MILQKIESAVAKNGASYNKLTIDGKTYNYFEALDTDLVVGAQVLCEFEQNGQYTNLKKISAAKANAPGNVGDMISPARHDVVLTRTEKPHSYEFGPANARHKIYYETVEELKAHVQNLVDEGLLDTPLTTPQD